ncbi:MAG: tail fiber domain-containing protein [Bacteroidota bacterium]
MRYYIQSLLLALVITFSFSTVYSQSNSVGINTSNPNENAVLELHSPNGNQGFLVPRLTTMQRDAMAPILTPDDNGLIVYDINLNRFLRWLDNGWQQGLGIFNGFMITSPNGDLTGSYPNPTIRVGAVTASKIAVDAVGTSKIRDGAVTESKIEDNAITNSKIADEAVSNSKLRNSGVTAGSYGNEFSIVQFTVNEKGIVTGATEVPVLINSSNIEDLSIINEDIANGTIKIEKIDPEGFTNRILSINADGDVTWLNRNELLNARLANNNIFVGDATNTAEGLPVVGDVTLTNNGSSASVTLNDNVVSTTEIINNTIITEDLADASVTGDKIVENAITTDKILNETIITADLANESVTNAKILDGAITTEKIADGTIITQDIANDAITTDKIVNQAVTGTKLNSDVAGPGLGQESSGALRINVGNGIVIDGDEIRQDLNAIAGNGLVESSSGNLLDVNVDNSSLIIDSDVVQVNNGGITSVKIADGAVTRTKVNEDVAGDGLGKESNGALRVNVSDGIQIVDDELTLDFDAVAGDGLVDNGSQIDFNPDNVTIEVVADQAQVKDAGITEAKIADNAVTSSKIQDGEVSTADLRNLNVTNAKIAADAITTDKILNETILTEDLSALSVTNPKIAADAVTTDKILDGEVKTEDIDDQNVTTAKIADDAIDRTKVNADVAGSGLGQDSDGSLLVNLGNGLLLNGDDLEVDLTTLAGNGLVNNGGIFDVGVDNTTIEITADQLNVKDEGITNDKLALDAVTTDEILNGTIKNEDLDKLDIPLSGFGDPEVDIDLAGVKITNLGNPDNAQDAATKSYVDDQVDASNDLTQGRIFVGDATDKATELDASGDSRILIGNGTTIQSVTVSGDIEIDNTGVTTIQDNAVQGDDLDVTSGNFVVTGNNQIQLQNNGGVSISNSLSVDNNLSAGGIVNLSSSGVNTNVRGILNSEELANFRENINIEGSLLFDNTGQAVEAISNDIATDNSNTSLATANAVKTYVDNEIDDKDLQEAYLSGNTITTSSAEGDLIIEGTEALNITSDGGLNVTNSASLGTLNVTGSTTTSSIDNSGNIQSQTINSLGDVTVGSSLTVGDQLSVTNNSILSGELDVSGGTILRDDLTVSGLTTLNETNGLQFGLTGQNVNNIITDGTLSGNSDQSLPTEQAVKTYVDSEVADINSLQDGRIYLGDVSNQAVERLISGDATLSNTGVLTISNDAVTTDKIADLNVTTDKLNTDAVTNAKLADNAVETVNILDGNVTTNKIGDLNVTTGKLANDAVDRTKVNSDVAGTGLGQNADGSLEVNLGTGLQFNGDDIEANLAGIAGDGLVDNAGVIDANVDGTTIEITTDALNVVAGGIGTTQLADDGVTTGKIANDAVTTNKIADDAVTSGKIANDAVTGSKIASDAVSGSKIAADAITLDKIAQNSAVLDDVMKWDGSEWVVVQDGVSASDARYKKDILEIPEALAKILELRGVTYYHRNEEFPTKNFSTDLQYGVIAQDLLKVFPDLVEVDKDGYYAVNYRELTPILLQAIKEQQSMIDSLNQNLKNQNTRINSLKAENNAIKSDIDQIKSVLGLINGNANENKKADEKK